MGLTYFLNEETLSGSGMTSGKIDKFPGRVFQKPVKRIKPKTLTFYIDNKDEEINKKKFNKRRKRNGIKGIKKRRNTKESL